MHIYRNIQYINTCIHYYTIHTYTTYMLQTSFTAHHLSVYLDTSQFHIVSHPAMASTSSLLAARRSSLPSSFLRLARSFSAAVGSQIDADASVHLQKARSWDEGVSSNFSTTPLQEIFQVSIHEFICMELAVFSFPFCLSLFSLILVVLFSFSFTYLTLFSVFLLSNCMCLKLHSWLLRGLGFLKVHSSVFTVWTFS